MDDYYDDAEQVQDQPDTVVTGCSHVPGKFLGQCLSKNRERYECALCGEEFSKYIENR